MHYIFLDLEWNNAYSKQHHRFVNEIIEIGAVKLNEQLTEVDRFDVFIKSRITKKLGTRFKNLTNISNEEMIEGVDFAEAVKLFSEFCGDDFITFTWSYVTVFMIICSRTVIDIIFFTDMIRMSYPGIISRNIPYYN